MLEKVNVIRKASGSIRKGADTIDSECNAVKSNIGRLLGQALDALAAVALEMADGDAPSTGSMGVTGSVDQPLAG